MKSLLLLLIVLGGVWLWRSRQQARPSSTQERPDPGVQAPVMQPCSRCGVHVPSTDAIRGTQGTYCCAEHLHQAET